MSQELVPAQPQPAPQWNVYGLATQLAAAQDALLATNLAVARERLNSELTRQTIASIDDETTAREKNMHLIEQVREYLPGISATPESSFVFHPKDVYGLRSLQSQLLWRKTHYAQKYIPTYIIGARDNTKSGRCNLLTIDAPIDGVKIQDTQRKINRYRIHRASLSNLATLSTQALEAPVDQDELRRVYNLKNRSFDLSAYTKGSIRQLPDLTPIPLVLGGIKGFVLSAGMPVGFSEYDALSQIGPNDREMAEYGVFENLGRLATLFGVGDKYQAILEEQGQVGQAMEAIEPAMSNVEPSNEDLHEITS